MLLNGLEVIFRPFDGSIFWLCCIYRLPLLFYLTQILTPHPNTKKFAWRFNINKHGLECVNLGYKLWSDTTAEISERGCTSANVLHSLPFTELRSVPASVGTDTGHFSRTSKLLRSAVKWICLKITICRWPQWDALVPSGLKTAPMQYQNDVGTVGGRWLIGGLGKEQERL